MSSRIDWRHYDYSDGPPPKNNTSHRNINPYSKSFAIRSSTPSPVNLNQNGSSEKENAIDNFLMETQAAVAGGHIEPMAAMLGVESASAGVIAPGNGRHASHANGNGNGTLRLPTNTSTNKSTNMSSATATSTKLTYRPPSCQTVNSNATNRTHHSNSANSAYIVNGDEMLMMEPSTNTSRSSSSRNIHIPRNAMFPSLDEDEQPFDAIAANVTTITSPHLQVKRPLPLNITTKNKNKSTGITPNNTDTGTSTYPVTPSDSVQSRQSHRQSQSEYSTSVDVDTHMNASVPIPTGLEGAEAEAITLLPGPGPGNSKKDGDFNDVWNEAEEEWEQAKSNSKSGPMERIIISDEEDKDNTSPTSAKQGHGPKHATHYQFDSFAGDRSSTNNNNNNNGNSYKTTGASVSVSELAESESSVGGHMEIPRTAAPVSILRSSGKFDLPSKNTGAGQSLGGASIGREPSPRRKHPWDQDYAEEDELPQDQNDQLSNHHHRHNPHDGPMDEMRKDNNDEDYEKTLAAEDEHRHEHEYEYHVDDETNLKQYEAEAVDPNAVEDEDDLQTDSHAYAEQQQQQQSSTSVSASIMHREQVSSSENIIATHPTPNPIGQILSMESELTDNRIPIVSIDERKEKRRRSRRRDGSGADTDDHLNGDIDAAEGAHYDDDSIEDPGDGNTKTRADTLQDRTKMAWSKRNQGVASANVNAHAIGSTVNNNVHNNHGQARTHPKRKEHISVSFQPEAAVHEFVQDEEEGDDDDDSYSGTQSDDDEKTEATEDGTYYTYDDDTYAGRSMHSVYTKSNESEVEDLFKDIFFVGSGKATNPGRRELKYRRENKDRIKEQQKRERDRREEYSSDEDDETISLEDQGTNGDEKKAARMTPLKDGKQQQQQQQSVDDDDEGSRMDSTVSRGTYEEEEEVDPFAVTYNYCEDLIFSLGKACGLTTPKSAAEGNKKDSSIESIKMDNELSAFESWEQYVTDLIFRVDGKGEEEGGNEEKREALLQLAINAARIKHLLQKSEYDEMHNLDVGKDIKIVFTSIGLPIGIVFSESPSGCWVKRIFDSGHAATSFRGDKIQVGDQLASINGVSAANTNVAEVCKLLANSPNSDDIELSCVRYIGPLRPASNEQQGYEVIDPRVSAKGGRFSPVNLAKTLSFQRKSKGPKNAEAESSRPSTPVEVIRVKASKENSHKKKMREVAIADTSVDPVTELSQDVTPPHKNKKDKKKRFGFLRRGKKRNK